MWALIKILLDNKLKVKETLLRLMLNKNIT